MSALNPKVRFVLCQVVIPVAKVLISQLEDEVRESPNPYDDVALEVARVLIRFAEENLCGGD